LIASNDGANAANPTELAEKIDGAANDWGASPVNRKQKHRSAIVSDGASVFLSNRVEGT
jgi:hypothetical protein